MKPFRAFFILRVAAAGLTARGGQPTQYGMQTTTGTPETVTVPKGTMTGGASVGDATARLSG